MKRFFSYCLLTATLILSAATINTNVCINDLTIWEHDRTDLHNEISVPSENSHFIMKPNAPVNPVALNNILNAGVPITATIWSNYYNLLKSCFTSLTNQQLYRTKSAYISLYAQKVKDGYYIYALRKLLI